MSGTTEHGSQSFDFQMGKGVRHKSIMEGMDLVGKEKADRDL